MPDVCVNGIQVRQPHPESEAGRGYDSAAGGRLAPVASERLRNLLLAPQTYAAPLSRYAHRNELLGQCARGLETITSESADAVAKRTNGNVVHKRPFLNTGNCSSNGTVANVPSAAACRRPPYPKRRGRSARTNAKDTREGPPTNSALIPPITNSGPRPVKTSNYAIRQDETEKETCSQVQSGYIEPLQGQARQGPSIVYTSTSVPGPAPKTAQAVRKKSVWRRAHRRGDASFYKAYHWTPYYREVRLSREDQLLQSERLKGLSCESIGLLSSPMQAQADDTGQPPGPGPGRRVQVLRPKPLRLSPSIPPKKLLESPWYRGPIPIPYCRDVRCREPPCYPSTYFGETWQIGAMSIPQLAYRWRTCEGEGGCCAKRSEHNGIVETRRVPEDTEHVINANATRASVICSMSSNRSNSKVESNQTVPQHKLRPHDVDTTLVNHDIPDDVQHVHLTNRIESTEHTVPNTEHHAKQTTVETAEETLTLYKAPVDNDTADTHVSVADEVHRVAEVQTDTTDSRAFVQEVAELVEDFPSLAPVLAEVPEETYVIDADPANSTLISSTMATMVGPTWIPPEYVVSGGAVLSMSSALPMRQVVAIDSTGVKESASIITQVPIVSVSFPITLVANVSDMSVVSQETISSPVHTSTQVPVLFVPSPVSQECGALEGLSSLVLPHMPAPLTMSARSQTPVLSESQTVAEMSTEQDVSASSHNPQLVLKPEACQPPANTQASNVSPCQISPLSCTPEVPDDPSRHSSSTELAGSPDESASQPPALVSCPTAQRPACSPGDARSRTSPFSHPSIRLEQSHVSPRTGVNVPSKTDLESGVPQETFESDEEATSVNEVTNGDHEVSNTLHDQRASVTALSSVLSETPPVSAPGAHEVYEDALPLDSIVCPSSVASEAPILLEEHLSPLMAKSPVEPSHTSQAVFPVHSGFSELVTVQSLKTPISCSASKTPTSHGDRHVYQENAEPRGHDASRVNVTTQNPSVLASSSAAQCEPEENISEGSRASPHKHCPTVVLPPITSESTSVSQTAPIKGLRKSSPELVYLPNLSASQCSEPAGGSVAALSPTPNVFRVHVYPDIPTTLKKPTTSQEKDSTLCRSPPMPVDSEMCEPQETEAAPNQPITVMASSPNSHETEVHEIANGVLVSPGACVLPASEVELYVTSKPTGEATTSPSITGLEGPRILGSSSASHMTGCTKDHDELGSCLDSESNHPAVNRNESANGPEIAEGTNKTQVPDELLPIIVPDAVTCKPEVSNRCEDTVESQDSPNCGVTVISTFTATPLCSPLASSWVNDCSAKPHEEPSVNSNHLQSESSVEREVTCVPLSKARPEVADNASQVPTTPQTSPNFPMPSFYQTRFQLADEVPVGNFVVPALSSPTTSTVKVDGSTPNILNNDDNMIISSEAQNNSCGKKHVSCSSEERLTKKRKCDEIVASNALISLSTKSPQSESPQKELYILLTRVEELNSAILPTKTRCLDQQQTHRQVQPDQTREPSPGPPVLERYEPQGSVSGASLASQSPVRMDLLNKVSSPVQWSQTLKESNPNPTALETNEDVLDPRSAAREQYLRSVADALPDVLEEFRLGLSKVLGMLCDDHHTDMALRDPTLLRAAARLLQEVKKTATNEEKRLFRSTSMVVRTMSRVLGAARHCNPLIQSMQDLLDPQHYMALVQAVQEIGKYDMGLNKFSLPAIQRRVKKGLKHVTAIIKEDARRERNTKWSSRISEFVNMHRRYGYTLSPCHEGALAGRPGLGLEARTGSGPGPGLVFSPRHAGTRGRPRIIASWLVEHAVCVCGYMERRLSQAVSALNQDDNPEQAVHREELIEDLAQSAAWVVHLVNFAPWEDVKSMTAAEFRGRKYKLTSVMADRLLSPVDRLFSKDMTKVVVFGASQDRRSREPGRASGPGRCRTTSSAIVLPRQAEDAVQLLLEVQDSRDPSRDHSPFWCWEGRPSQMASFLHRAGIGTAAGVRRTTTRTLSKLHNRAKLAALLRVLLLPPDQRATLAAELDQEAWTGSMESPTRVSHRDRGRGCSVSAQSLRTGSLSVSGRELEAEQQMICSLANKILTAL